jgi:hypothetical protein
LAAVFLLARWIAAKRKGKVFLTPTCGIDALSFASSILLMLATIYPRILAAIGDTGPYLLFAGVTGAILAIRATLND